MELLIELSDCLRRTGAGFRLGGGRPERRGTRPTRPHRSGSLVLFIKKKPQKKPQKNRKKNATKE